MSRHTVSRQTWPHIENSRTGGHALGRTAPIQQQDSLEHLSTLVQRPTAGRHTPAPSLTPTLRSGLMAIGYFWQQ